MEASDAPTATRGPVAGRLAQTLQVRAKIQRDFQTIVDSMHCNDWTREMLECLMQSIHDLPARTRNVLLANPGLVERVIAEQQYTECSGGLVNLLLPAASQPAPQPAPPPEPPPEPQPASSAARSGTSVVATTETTLFQGLLAETRTELEPGDATPPYGNSKKKKKREKKKRQVPSWSPAWDEPRADPAVITHPACRSTTCCTPLISCFSGW